MKIKKDKHGRVWWRCTVTQTRTGDIEVLARNKEEALDKIFFQNYGSAQENWDWPNVKNEVTSICQYNNFTEEADNE